jgi:hypothetical protein
MNYSSSQIGQDRFVIESLNGKTNGTFLDIGCAGPVRFSNTHILEKFFNWSGIGIDIIDVNEENGTWAFERPNTKHFINDALKIDYHKLMQDNNMPSTIDYLSIDLEPPDLTLECLMLIPFDFYKFNVITFETDEYRSGGQERAKKSREYLASKGYKFIKNVNMQDDFYVLNELI